MSKQLKWLFETVFFYCAVTFLKLFPFRIRTKILGNFCSFLGSIMPQVRGRILENLRHAFPQKSSKWHRQLMSKNLYNLGRTVSEYIQMPLNAAFYERWLHYLPDRETYRKIFSAPAIFILGHLGNIEFASGGASYASNRRVRLYGVAKRQRNPWIDRKIKKMRMSQNSFQIYKDENPRRVFRILKEGHIVAFPADQDAGKKGPFYPFFGRLASTYQGPAFFARLTKYPVYFIWSYHNEKGEFFCEIKELSRPKLDPRATKEWDREFTYSWVKLLEEKASLHPADYYFLHKRWRHQPEDAQKVWDFWHDWERKKGYPLSVPSAKSKIILSEV